MKTKITARIALCSLIILAFAAPVSQALNARDIIEMNVYNGPDHLGFSLLFPTDWEEYNVTEIELELGEGLTAPGVDIGKLGEPAVITISRHTVDEWNSIMALNDGPVPSMLGAGKGFVIGYSTNQETFNDEWQWILNHISIHSKDLSDIGGHANETAIQYLADNLIVSGYPDATFKPEQTINRAELMKIITEASGAIPNESKYNNCFPDVTDEWFALYVCYAKDKNWVQGYPDGNFKPANDINKVEALKMIVNSQGMNIPGSVNETLFNDVDNSTWYAPFVKTAKDNGLLEQADGSYGVDELITRGEVSENIYRGLLISALDSYGDGNLSSNNPPENPEDIIASINGYAVFDSATYNFSIEYPNQWFYQGLNADPFSGVRVYNFGPNVSEGVDPLVTVEVSSAETPDGTVIDMNDKELILLNDGVETNIYYMGEVTGRRFRVHGASEYEEVMLNMASSIEDRKAIPQSGY